MATPWPRRLLPALIATATTAALFLAAPTATADGSDDGSGKDGSPPAAVTSGTNGTIAWTILSTDSLGGVDGGQLSSTAGTYYGTADGLAPRDPEWSPDGTELAYWGYSASPRSDAGLWVLGQPFGISTTPRHLTTGSSDSDPTWSPDGTKIAFLRSGPGAEGIYVVNAAGGTPYRIIDPGVFAEDLAWSPDGTRIAYANYCCGYGTTKHVYVLDLDSASVVDIGEGLSPSWKPDGTKLVFEHAYSSTDHDIYTMNPDGTDRTGLQTGTVNDVEPTWSPDGKQVAFIRSNGVYTWPLSGGNATKVSSDTLGFVESTTWGSIQASCQGRATTISGTPGADTLVGSRGVDVINGLGGDDTIIGLQGQDVICGGAGTDTVSYEGQTAPAHAVIGETDPQSGVSDLIGSDVEYLIGGAGPDTLVGDDRANVIRGGRGDDTVFAGGGGDSVLGGGGDDILVGDDGDDDLAGEGGEDVLRGGDGDDLLIGGDDADRMVGGPGTLDTADYTGRAQPVSVTIGGGPGDDGGKPDGGAGDRDTVTGSVENLTGGNGADTLIGNDLNNQIRGNLGADTMRGGEGRDLIRAQDGVADLVIDCGADTDSAAVKDAIDPAPISCP